MPVTIELREENRVIFMVFEAPLRLQEIFDIYPLDKSYRDHFSHKIHALVDIRKMGKIPAGVLSARHAPDFTHPNSGYVVVIGADRLARVMGSMMAQIQGKNFFKFFDTHEEAWTFLRKIIAEDKQAEV